MTSLADIPKQLLVAQANTLRILEVSGPVQLPSISQTLSAFALSLPSIPIALPGGGGGLPGFPAFGPINANLAPAQRGQGISGQRIGVGTYRPTPRTMGR